MILETKALLTMSLTTAWDKFTLSCDCGHDYGTMNCAHFLSNALINAGFSAINGGKGGDMRNVKGFCVCRSGRPIRAKELRSWFNTKWTKHSKPPKDGIIAIYQEHSGQGHVLLGKYENDKLTGSKGTGPGYYSGWNNEYYY